MASAIEDRQWTSKTRYELRRAKIPEKLLAFAEGRLELTRDQLMTYLNLLDRILPKLAQTNVEHSGTVRHVREMSTEELLLEWQQEQEARQRQLQ